MNRPRVLVLTSGREVGGAEIAAARLTNALASRGLHVEFVSGDWAPQLPSLDVPHHVVRSLSPHRKHLLPLGLKELHRIVRDFEPDIIHSHHRWMNLQARVVRPKNSSVVWHCHWQAPASLFNGLANHVIAVSEVVRQHLLTQRPSTSVTTVLNAMPPVRDSDTELDTDCERAFLFAGRLTPGKGAEWAVRSVSQIAGATLLIAGEGPLRDELEVLARDLGCSDRVRFLGFVPDPLNLPPRFFVFPTRDYPEGLPLVILEAMAAGKAIIATRTGGITEVLDETCAKLVSPEREHELREAMEWMLDHPDEAHEFRANVRNRARGYGDHEWATAVEGCFSEVLLR